MSLLDLHRSGSYSSGKGSTRPLSEPSPVQHLRAEAGGGSPSEPTLKEKRQAWGREWGAINADIGKRLRERNG